MELPRFWIVMQILIVIFVLIGMVIAITKLAARGAAAPPPARAWG